MARRLLLLCALVAVGCTGARLKLRLGETVSLGKGEFYANYVEARSAGHDVELSVFFRWTGPVSDLMGGFIGPKMKMTLLDSEGSSYSPSRPSRIPMRPVPEEIYWIMRNSEMYEQSRGQDKSLEANAEVDADRMDRLEADLKAGRNPVHWVQFFKVPSDRSGFSLVVENPDRQSGQPSTVEVSLGR